MTFLSAVEALILILDIDCHLTWAVSCGGGENTFLGGLLRAKVEVEVSVDFSKEVAVAGEENID